jgi:Kef-type K+ transport system membrane component KefB
MSGIAVPIIDFGLLIIAAMILGGVALMFRQPLILAYIVAGILLGSQGLGLIHDEQYLYEFSSELGIAMLLFVVGLELSIKKMMEVRKVVTFGVIAQSILFVIIGMFVGYMLDFTLMESIYIGLTIAFASTLLIVKALGEKHQVDTLAGRILIGSLVFEDILVIVTISILGVMAGVEPTGFVSWVTHLPGVSLIPYIQNIALFFGALLLFGFAYLLNRWVARYLFRFFSQSAEMLFVSALGFLFILAFIAGELGFSVAIGAFIAGVIVANTDYYLDVLGKVKTLATFFALLFFATLGFKVTFENFMSLLIPVVVISLVVAVIKPLIVGMMVRFFEYDKNTSIMTGLHMAQISEFGLILITFGIKFKHVREELLTITILVLLVTFTISMYYMNYAHAISSFLQRKFKFLAPDHNYMPEIAIKHADTVLYGAEHVDDQFITDICAKRPHFLVIDPDPDTVQFIRERNVPVIIGSLSNEEVLEKLPMDKLEILISTIPDVEEGMLICDHIRKHSKKTILILTTRSMREALTLYHHGASYVHVADFTEDTAVRTILADMDQAKIDQLRKQHIDKLSKIVARAHRTVDIEDFVSSLADQHITAGRRAIERTTKPVMQEVDKFVSQLKKK